MNKDTKFMTILNTTGIPFAAGATLGYSDAVNHDFENTLDKALTYGPTIAYTGLGAISGPFFGFADGLKFAKKHKKEDKLKKYSLIGAGLGIPFYATIGGVCSAVSELVGYGVGYGTASIVEKFF